MSNKPLVFVHIPKTAGTSFKLALEKVISSNQIAMDYGINDKNTSPLILNSMYQNEKKLDLLSLIEQNQISLLIGHFAVAKYFNLLKNEVNWCTFLRNPIERIISEYKHFVRHNNYSDSFEAFYENSQMINRQFQLTKGLNLEQFYFVGITEKYNESITLFNQITNMHLENYHVNKNPEKATSQYQLEQTLVEKLKSFNKLDIQLYQKAVNLLEQRLLLASNK